MGWIGGWNCNPATIDQWPGPPGNITLLVGGAAPLVNDGIAGWTGTDQCRPVGPTCKPLAKLRTVRKLSASPSPSP
jgi:hypothetical protein